MRPYAGACHRCREMFAEMTAGGIHMHITKKTKLYGAGLLLFLILLAAICLAKARGSKGGDILAGASPDTSALQLYYFDGETVTVRTLYDSSREKELIKRINASRLKETDETALAGLEPPFYGIWIGGADGHDVLAAWSEGIWLKNDGRVYRGEADFPSWWEELEKEDEDEMAVFNFPNAGRLAEYNVLFMKKEERDISQQAGKVAMAIESISGSEITVTISNDSGEEFVYGEYYSLQKKIDGSWYTMPVWEDNIGFADIACILPSGERVTKTYDCSIFGPLKPGEYKLVVENMGVEFAVTE